MFIFNYIYSYTYNIYIVTPIISYACTFRRAYTDSKKPQTMITKINLK